MHFTENWVSEQNYVKWTNANGPVSQMRASLPACRELALFYDTLPKLLYVFKHKTWHVLIHAPYTRIVVFIK